MRLFASGISLFLFCMIFAGCATVPLEESFRAIEQSVKDEQGFTIHWWGVTSPEDAGAEAVSQLLTEGLTVEETAAKMDKTAGAVRGLMDRANVKIRESMQTASRFFSDG